MLPPAKSVAAPSERAVATAGAMWVIDWNRTSVSPIAFRSRLCGDDDAMPTSLSHLHRRAAARLHRMQIVNDLKR